MRPTWTNGMGVSGKRLSRLGGASRCLAAAVALVGPPLLAGLAGVLPLPPLLAPAAALAADGTPDAEATRQYAVALGFQKKALFDQAAARWTKFIQTFPKDERLENAHYHLGVCQFQLQKWADASTTFRHVLATFPKFKDRDGAQYNLSLAQYNLALASKKPEDFRQTATLFADVPAKFAQSAFIPDSLYYQAECLYQAGDKEAAVAAYQKVAAGYPMSPLQPDVHYALATAQQELEKHDDAAKTYETFLQKFPQAAQAPECRLRLGMTQLKLKKFPKAEKLFAESAAIPNFPFADFALLQQGQSLFEQNKLPEAATAYESLPAKFAKSAYLGAAMLAGGKCRYKLGQFPAAQADFAAIATQKGTEAPEAAYWLGRSLIQQKKPAEALAALDQALAAFPQSEFAPQLAFARVESIADQEARRAEAVTLYADYATKHPQNALAADAVYRASLGAFKLADYAGARKHADAFLANAAWAKHALTPEVLYLAGESAILATPADLAKGEAAYRRLIAEFAMHKDVPHAQLRVAFCLQAAKKYDEAVALLTAAVASFKDPAQVADARLQIGQGHMEMNRLPDAVAAFRAATAAKPDWDRGDEVLYSLGRALRAQNDLPAATTELAALNAKFPKSAYRDRALHLLGAIAFDQKQYDASVKAYQQAVAEFPRGDVAALCQYGAAAAFYEKGDDANAVAELTKLLANYPMADVSKSGLHLRGLSQHRMKKHAEAAQDLQKFLDAKPAESDRLSAQFALGLAQSAAGQHAPAAATFAALLQSKPDFKDADKLAYKLGGAQYLRKQYAEAVATLETQIKEHPQGKLLHDAEWLAAESHYRLSKFDAALPLFQKVAASPADRYHARALYRSGDCAGALKQWPQSQQFFQALIDKHPKFEQLGEARYGLGFAQQNQQQLDAALKTYEQVTKETETETAAKARYMMGECAVAQKKPADAALHFLEAALAYPYDEWRALGHYEAGRCFIELKDPAKARDALETVVKKYPQHPRAKEAAALLAGLDAAK